MNLKHSQEGLRGSHKMGVVIPQSFKLKMVKYEALSVLGLATIEVPILEKRNLLSGFGCFDNPVKGDWVEIEIIDKDNILGNGVDYLVDSYNDENYPLNKGWYMFGLTEIEALIKDDLAEMPQGLYLRIKGHRASGAAEDILRINLKWGERLR